MSKPDLYQILGVPRNATRAAVKAAYRAKVKRVHPDVGGKPEDFRLLLLARDILSDADRRRRYDESGILPTETIERNFDSKVYVVAGDVLLAVLPQIKSPNYENVLILMREWVASHLVELERRISDLDLSVEKMTVVEARIQTDRKDNLLRSLVAGRRGDLRDQRELAMQEHQLYESVQDFLDDYHYFTQIENVLISTDIWSSR